MTRLLISWFFALVFAFMSPLPLGAQSGTLALDTVVVTADRSAETLREVSQNMDVITEEEIQKSSAREVTDVLKQHGIQIDYNNSPGSGEEGVTMRGFSTSMHGNDINSNLLILIDGRRAVSDSLSLVSLNNIARIEIIRGPGAVQYGSSAMGGVINIITKRGGPRPNIRLESGFGSFDQRKHSFFGSGQKDKLDFALGASYFTIDDFIDGSGQKHHNSGLDYRTGSMANLGWNFSENHRLGLSAQTSKNKDAGREYSDPLLPRYVNKDMSLLDLLYEGSDEDGDKSWLGRYFFGNSTYQIDQTSTSTANTPIGQRIRDIGRYKSSESENDFQGAQAQLSLGLDRLGLTGGLDWVYYDYTQEQWSIPTSGANAASIYRSSTNDADYENLGAFLLSKVYFLEDKNLILSGGLRLDRYDVTIDTKHYNNTSDAVIGGNAMEKSYDKVLPSLGLAYNPVDFLKLRTHYAHAYKVPTPRELAGGYYMSTANSPFLGNPYLKPESSKTWELGFDFNRSNLGLSGTYFHTNYDNYMMALTTIPVAQYPYPGPKPASGTVSWYENIPTATITGLEGRLVYELGRQLGWGAQVTPYINWTRLLTYETGDKRTLPNLAEDSLGFGTSIEYEPFGLTINLDGTYYGAPKVRSFANQNDPRYAVTRKGGATVWDLSTVKRLFSFGDDWGELKAKFAAQNLFDKYYNISESSSSGPGNEVFMPGSSYYIGLIYEFK